MAYTRGHGSKLTRKRIKLLTKARRAGLPLSQVATYCGISLQTYYNWMEGGREDRDKLPSGGKVTLRVELLEALERAEAEFIAESMERISQAARGGAKDVKVVERLDDEGKVVERTTTTSERRAEWTADAWLLERQFPKHFARTVQNRLTNKDGDGPVEVGVSWLDVMAKADEEDGDG